MRLNPFRVSICGRLEGATIEVCPWTGHTTDKVMMTQEGHARVLINRLAVMM